MANTNAPNGFVPIRHLTGGVIRPLEYAIANGLAANLASGELVTLTTDGTIIRGTAGGTALGVFYGVEYQDNTSGDVKFVKVWNSGTTVKANTPVKAYVYDDPYTVFKVQSAGTPAQTNIGNCADVVAGTGSTITGQSGFELSGTMSNGTATCKILGLYEGPENAFGTNAIMEVLINEHLLKDSAGI